MATNSAPGTARRESYASDVTSTVAGPCTRTFGTSRRSWSSRMMSPSAVAVPSVRHHTMRVHQTARTEEASELSTGIGVEQTGVELEQCFKRFNRLGIDLGKVPPDKRDLL